MVEIKKFVTEEGIDLGDLMAEKLGPHSQGFCYVGETNRGEGIYYGLGTTILVNGDSLSITGEDNLPEVRRRLEEILDLQLTSFVQSTQYQN